MAEKSGIEELGENAAVGTERGNIIEYEPDKARAVGELEIQAADETLGTLIPEGGFLKARDELQAKIEEKLGVPSLFGLIASALSAGVTSDRLGIENIQGFGVGLKNSGGSYTGEIAVKMYVKEKAPLGRLDSSFSIPSEVNGYPTDVEEIGEITAQLYNRRYPRPVPCGVSCGHVKITAGTLSCLIVLNNNRLAILSNNHVLANENDARPGDSILQPGRYDSGQDPQDRIGVLERFVPIQFPGPNLVDCAAAWTSFRLVKPQHMTYFLNPRPLAPGLGLMVMKNGRTTQATLGIITGIHVNNVSVGYNHGVAVFDNQIIIRGIGSAPFSQGGDSGSLIASTSTRQPVGLLFAGSSTHTIANQIDEVIRALGISQFVGP